MNPERLRHSEVMENSNEKAKSRASRIDLDYYRRPDRFQRLRHRLCLISPLLVLAVLAVSQILGSHSSVRSRSFKVTALASPGPVAKAHALWESQCEVCHRPGESLNPQRTISFFHASPNEHARCIDCHQNNIHHENLMLQSAQSCAACHRDHQGRDASLTLVSDSHCISCHKDLSDSQKKKNEKTPISITEFEPGQHPEFRIHQSLNEENSKLKFSHQLHLASGLNAERDGIPLFRYRDLPESVRKRYGMDSEDELEKPVRLNCQSCHESHASEINSELGVGVSAVRPRAIRFEKDCAACHPLSVPGPETQTVEVKHGLNLPELETEVRHQMIQTALATDTGLLQRRQSELFIPGKTGRSLDPQVKRLIDEKTKIALELMLGKSWKEAGPNGKRGCVECHNFQKNSDSYDVVGREKALNQFQAAEFDHSRHTLIDCNSCHAVANSEKLENRLLPKISSCFECHANRSFHPNASANAGSSCTTCHKYHNSSLIQVNSEKRDTPRLKNRAVEALLKKAP